MSVIDVDVLLQAVSTDSPCGEDFVDHPTFGEMEKASRPKLPREFDPEGTGPTPPDWNEVRGKGLELLSETKDLRVAAYLTKAWLNIDGLPGLCSGLQLSRGLLESFWESAHPRLDADDKDSPLLRTLAIESVAEPETTLEWVDQATLVSSKVFGAFSLRDVDIAAGRVAPPGNKVVDEATMNAAFQEAPVETVETTRQVLQNALEHLAAIEVIFAERSGADKAPRLQPLADSLKRALNIVNAQLEQRGKGQRSGAATENAADPGLRSSEEAASPTNGIRSRDDAARLLEQVCEFFERNEPSSPIPLLVRRARRLISKDFMEIIQDLAPTGLAQAESFQGVQEDAGEGKSPE